MAVPPEERRKKRKPAGIPTALYYSQAAFPEGPPLHISWGGLVYQFSGTVNNSYQYVLTNQTTRVSGVGNLQENISRTYAPGATHWGSASRVAGNSGNNSVR